MLGMTWADFAPYAWSCMILPLLIVAVIAYFCGCFNGAVIVSKYILHDDVRTHGSGNAGLTNFHRTFGGPLTFVVILCDVLKEQFVLLMENYRKTPQFERSRNAEDNLVISIVYRKIKETIEETPEPDDFEATLEMLQKLMHD